MDFSTVFGGMLLTAVAIVVGAAIGLARGGSLKAVLKSPLRAWPILIAGMVLHTVAEQWAVPARLSVLVVGSFLLVVSALLNVHLKGAVVSGIGISLNLAAVVANGHVPIRYEALVAAGEVGPEISEERVVLSGLWQLEGTDTNLRQLGDIVPLAALEDVVSFGDLILIAGLTVLTMNLVRDRRRIGPDLDELLGHEDEEQSGSGDGEEINLVDIDLVQTDDPAFDETTFKETAQRERMQ